MESDKKVPETPKVPWYKRLFNAIGEAIGQAKFGQ